MVEFKKAFAALTAATLAGLIGAGTAKAEKIGMRIELQGRVGVVCKLDFASATVVPTQGSQIDFGVVGEFCNAANGYRISVNYDPNMLGGAQLRLGADAVEFGTSGSEVVTRYEAANIRQRPMSMTLARSLTGPAAISLRIEAHL